MSNEGKKHIVTNRQLRDNLTTLKLNLHKPTIKFEVCVDECGHKEVKVASIEYPNE